MHVTTGNKKDSHRDTELSGRPEHILSHGETGSTMMHDGRLVCCHQLYCRVADWNRLLLRGLTIMTMLLYLINAFMFPCLCLSNTVVTYSNRVSYLLAG